MDGDGDGDGVEDEGYGAFAMFDESRYDLDSDETNTCLWMLNMTLNCHSLIANLPTFPSPNILAFTINGDVLY